MNEERHAVRDISGSIAASDYAANPSGGIENHRPRVSTLREWTGLRVAREDSHLLRHLTRPTLSIFANKGTDGVQAADSEVRGISVL